MRKFYFILIFLACFSLLAFGDDDQEEIDYLLFLPNISNMFVNEEQAKIQLNNAAKYLTGRNLIPGQIYVYGYAAVALNDIEPLNLSRDRALFVINELQKCGVSKELFSDPVGYGSVDIWGSNTTEENMSPNRRVRILVDGSIITPVIMKAAEPEIEVSNVEKEIEYENLTDTKNSRFPWEIFLILIPIALILAILSLLSRNKKRSKPDTHKIPESVSLPKAAVVTASPTIVNSATPAPLAANPTFIKSTAAAPVITYTTVNLDEEIRIRAYELYLKRNGQDGDMDGDWYIALGEISRKYEADGYQIYHEAGYWWARKAKKA